MAILGSLIDITTVSRVGDDVDNSVSLSALAHSLPATAPDAVFVNLRSIQGSLGAGGSGLITPFVLGGNASQSTLGYAITASQVSTPTVMFDVVAVVFHSLIR